MKNPTKVVVLENDAEHMGIPEVIKKPLDILGIEHEDWNSFVYDFITDRVDASFLRMKQIAESGTIFLSVPSFSGPDNQFGLYMNLFKKLKEMEVKIHICLVYYKSFYSYVLNYLYDESNKRKRTEKENSLRGILEYHDIFFSEFLEVNRNPQSLFEGMTQLTWESIDRNLYRNYDHVKIIATNEIMQVSGAYVIDKDDAMESEINLVPLEYDFNKYTSKDETELKFKDVEPVFRPRD